MIVSASTPEPVPAPGRIVGSLPDASGPAPRVRFAPSPTGYFHVGSGRTALFNWMFARRHGGVFILRIEDTDAERNREEWLDGIVDSMTWLGLDWDEGPYRQSARAPAYAGAVARLVGEGKAYYCSCSRDEIEARVKATDRQRPGYDGYCRDRKLAASGPDGPHALRFKVDPGDPVVVEDVIRGEVTTDRSVIDDFVIAKASGAPLFVLANAVDDIDMEITHVIRGEDLLPTTPKGILVWQGLTDKELPVFAHLPMLVNEKRQKLSKRRDPVAIEQYRAEGYLPEAFVNYLALLGWSPKADREVLPLEEMIAEFRLEDVNHSPAFFDVAKLKHFNGEYIRAMSAQSFVEESLPWLGVAGPGLAQAESTELPPWPPEAFELEVFSKIAPLVQERVTRLCEVPDMVAFLFTESTPMDEGSWEKAVSGNEKAPEILQAALEKYPVSQWNAESLKATTESIGDSVGLKLGKVQAPIRVAVTGNTVGPPLFESLEVMGSKRVLSRIDEALGRIGDKRDQ